MAKKEIKMNGYDLTLKMRKSRRKYALSATDQALYYELMAICNEENWDRYFSVSNYELCVALKISENTLVKTRAHLIEAGLISFKSGKSKRKYSTYSFLTTSNFEVNHTGNDEVQNRNTPSTTSNFEGNEEAKPEPNPADYYKDKEKLNSKNIYINDSENLKNDPGEKYTEKEFLKRWESARKYYDKSATYISKLKPSERKFFEELVKEYSQKEFDNAIGGLLFQETYPATRIRPTHLLENFEMFLDCWKNQKKLYEKKKDKSRNEEWYGPPAPKPTRFDKPSSDLKKRTGDL